MDLRDVVTYRDTAVKLITRFGLSGSDREVNQLRVAIADAYRDLPGMHNWRYYTRQLTFMTSATVTVDVSYDHTGGAHERLMTITGTGTWPADAEYGEVRIGTETFQVERRVSDTLITLSRSANPGADTSGSCVWMRSTYTLPYPPRQVHEVWRADGTGRLAFTIVSNLGVEVQFYDETATPWRYTLLSSRSVAGGTDIKIIPAPSEAKNYQVTCEIRPWSLLTYDISDTDGAVTSGSTTFTSARGAFTNTLVGSVIRLSSTSAMPRGKFDFDFSRPEFTFQTFVRRVINGTSLELADAAPSTLSGVGYVISDPIDIEYSVMQNYFEALCWEKFAMNHDNKSLPQAKAVAKEELEKAMTSESSYNWNVQTRTMPWLRLPGGFSRVDSNSLY